MFYGFWEDILHIIKQQYISIAGLKEADFFQSKGSGVWQTEYCLRNPEINMLCNMNDRHRAEIGTDMDFEMFSYICSKKALNYNIFGNDFVHFRPNNKGIPEGEYRIEYSKRIPLLKTKNSAITIDTILYSEENESIIIVNTQFLEWIILGNKPVKEHFFKPENYFDYEAGCVFSETVRNLIPLFFKEEVEYFGANSNFDSLTLFRIITAVYNIIFLESYKNIKNISIVSCKWHPLYYEKFDQYGVRIYNKNNEMRREFNNTCVIISQLINYIEEKYKVKINIKMLNMIELLQIQDKNEEKLMWIKRFIV